MSRKLMFQSNSKEVEMETLHGPPSFSLLIEHALEKLDEVEDVLRRVLLFVPRPNLSDLLVEADASIQRAIVTLKKAHRNRRQGD